MNERNTDVWHISVCFRNTSLNLIAFTHWTVQWKFKVVILAELDVWFWKLLLSSPDAEFLQLWAEVDREPRRKLVVAHHCPTTSGVRQLLCSQSGCKRQIRALFGSNKGRRGNICQGSDGALLVHLLFVFRSPPCLSVHMISCFSI